MNTPWDDAKLLFSGQENYLKINKIKLFFIYYHNFINYIRVLYITGIKGDIHEMDNPLPRYF